MSLSVWLKSQKQEGESDCAFARRLGIPIMTLRGLFLLPDTEPRRKTRLAIANGLGKTDEDRKRILNEMGSIIDGDTQAA